MNWKLEAGDTVEYVRQGNKVILNTEALYQKRDRELIEESFADFEQGLHVTEEQIVKEFEKHGWGKE